MIISTRSPLIPLMLIAALLVSPATAQSQFAAHFKKAYRLRSVSCSTCHQKEAKKKSKQHLTDFGNTLAKLLDGKQITERLEAAKKKTAEERAKVKEAVDKDLAAALKKLDEMKAPSGKKFAEAIRGGEINGMKPRK